MSAQLLLLESRQGLKCPMGKSAPPRIELGRRTLRVARRRCENGPAGSFNHDYNDQGFGLAQ